jgi:hypothetical protein
MKKYVMILVVFLAICILEAKEAKAITVRITVVTGSGKDCVGFGICSITIDIRATLSGGNNTELSDGTAEVKGGKLYVALSKGLSDRAVNEKGVKSVTIISPQRLSQDVAKQLGFSDLTILPGNYLMNGNSFTFDVKGSSVSKPVKSAATNTK